MPVIQFSVVKQLANEILEEVFLDALHVQKVNLRELTEGSELCSRGPVLHHDAYLVFIHLFGPGSSALAPDYPLHPQLLKNV